MQFMIIRIFSVISAFLGITLIASVIFPLFSYQLEAQRFKDLISPVPGLVKSVSSGEEVSKGDLTKASNWFVGGAPEESFEGSKVSFYTISIPKLRIENATVAVGGNDLSKSLIQYPGTALPGKRGNSVIFGHSILPQFYNPKDYISIFSTLPTLRKGDEVIVNYDGIVYEFRVEEMFEVKPTDIDVLEQNLSDSFITLVTCVPPGHPLKPKRLIVRARLVPS